MRFSCWIDFGIGIDSVSHANVIGKARIGITSNAGRERQMPGSHISSSGSVESFSPSRIRSPKLKLKQSIRRSDNNIGVKP